jgi:hypothetical protein
MIKVGDKVKFLVGCPQGANNVNKGDIGTVLNLDTTGFCYRVDQGVNVWAASYDQTGITFEILPCNSPTGYAGPKSTIQITSNIDPVQVEAIRQEFHNAIKPAKHACRCDFRDLYANGCRCGGI